MPVRASSDAAFVSVWKELQSATSVAKHFGTTVRSTLLRRKRIEKRLGITLPTVDSRGARFGNFAAVEHSHGVARFDLQDGVILVGSDAHIWPGPLSTMQRAFLKFAKDIRPSAVIANGDFFDGARVSRHPRIGFLEKRPKVHEELRAVQEYMLELKAAAPKAKRFWTLGNHDARFESMLAGVAGEYENVKGVHLKDHFDSDWLPCWRVDVNQESHDYTVIRHREKGGVHADYRNVVESGVTMVTGHDHRAVVRRYRNYRGIYYGVRDGYLGDSPLDPQYVHYLEAKEPDWHPAFAVLTYAAGALLCPELVLKWDDDHVQFRGEIIKV